MKKDINFTNWLTNKDIKNIIENSDLKLDDERYDDYGKLVKPIRRYTNNAGEKIIDVFCKTDKNKVEDYIYQKTLGRVFPFLQGDYLALSKTSWLIIKDFEILLISPKSEELYMDEYQKINKIYNEYMTKKFGDFYTQKRRAYIKKEIKAEKMQNNQENEL